LDPTTTSDDTDDSSRRRLLVARTGKAAARDGKRDDRSRDLHTPRQTRHRTGRRAVGITRVDKLNLVVVVAVIAPGGILCTQHHQPVRERNVINPVLPPTPTIEHVLQAEVERVAAASIALIGAGGTTTTTTASATQAVAEEERAEAIVSSGSGEVKGRLSIRIARAEKVPQPCGLRGCGQQQRLYGFVRSACSRGFVEDVSEKRVA
jgi:hypothetical protein